MAKIDGPGHLIYPFSGSFVAQSARHFFQFVQNCAFEIFEYQIEPFPVTKHFDHRYEVLVPQLLQKENRHTHTCEL